MKEIKRRAKEHYSIIKFNLGENVGGTGDKYPKVGLGSKCKQYEDDSVYIDLNRANFVGDKAFTEGISVNSKKYLFAIQRENLGIDNENSYNYKVQLITMLNSGRKLSGAKDMISDYAYLTNDTIIIRTIYFDNGNLKGEYYLCSLEKQHFHSKQTNESLPIYEIKKTSREEGKTFWQNTKKYLEYQELQRINHEKNLMKKTEPSLSKEDRQCLKRIKKGVGSNYILFR